MNGGKYAFPHLNANSDATLNSLMLNGSGVAADDDILGITANELVTGSALSIRSASSNTSSRNIVEIANDNASATGAECLALIQEADEVVCRINSPKSAAKTVFLITNASASTTGGLIFLQSDSTDTSTRDLFKVSNESSSATGAYCLTLSQNADNAFMNLIGTAAANTTDPISTLTTPGAIIGFEQVDINGTKRWRALYADPS